MSASKLLETVPPEGTLFFVRSDIDQLNELAP